LIAYDRGTMNDLHYLVLSAALTWIMLMTAAMVRSRGWTLAGMRIALGNRDRLPEATPLAARADRAARNMVENLVLFAVVVLAARLVGAPAELLARGAALFFWARLVYFFVYLAGIPYLRTAVWAVSIAGLVLIALPVLQR
jgi:uncharacterized MAPEG superfamily protein